MTAPRHEKLLADLAELKLHRIAELYQEVLNEAARKQSSILDVLAALIGEEVIVRRQRALERRLRHARLPKCKTLAGRELPTLRWYGPPLAPRSQARLHGQSAPWAASDPRPCPEPR